MNRLQTFLKANHNGLLRATEFQFHHLWPQTLQFLHIKRVDMTAADTPHCCIINSFLLYLINIELVRAVERKTKNSLLKYKFVP